MLCFSPACKQTRCGVWGNSPMEDPTQRRLKRKGEGWGGGAYLARAVGTQAGMQRRQKSSREEIGRK